MWPGNIMSPFFLATIYAVKRMPAETEIECGKVMKATGDALRWWSNQLRIVPGPMPLSGTPPRRGDSFNASSMHRKEPGWTRPSSRRSLPRWAIAIRR